MVIGGENAKTYRSKMVKILQRYYAGDGSLLDEVEANAQSDGAVQQMARASLAAEKEQEEQETQLTLPLKRRKLELEVAKLEADIEAQQIANRAAELENDAKRIANGAAELDNDAKRIANGAAELDNDAKRIANGAAEQESEAKRKASEHEHLTKVTSSYQDLCKDTIMDERARLILKDNFLNMAMVTSISAPAEPSIGKPTSLSMVAEKLKLKLSTNELISLGQELKKKYVEKHGKPPSKHQQLCGGRATMVNTYMEADEPLIEEVLQKFAAGRA